MSQSQDHQPVPAVTGRAAAEASRELTGDHAVDEVLGQLDAATGEPLDIQIEASERVHAVLQARLADLGQE